VIFLYILSHKAIKSYFQNLKYDTKRNIQQTAENLFVERKLSYVQDAEEDGKM